MDNQEKNMNTAAIIVGDWHFNSLGLARSLGEENIPCYFINMSQGGYAENSKYVKKTIRVFEEKAVIEAILDIANESEGVSLLFPSSDLAALYVDKNRERLKDKCICPGANGHIEKIMDKAVMCQAAKRAGFNVPTGEVIELDEDGKALVKAFKKPCLIKPLLSVEGKKADITVCRSEMDIEQALDFLYSKESEYKRIFIQEFVEGSNNLMVEYSGCKIPGQKSFMFGQLEKIREYPMNRGSTSFSVIKKNISYIDKRVVDDFLDNLGFDGIFDIEIKVVDGVPYFIEVNLRNGAPSYAFTKGGFNMALVWYYAKLGMDVPTIDFNEVYMMSERDDLNNVIDRNISIFKWLKDVSRTDVMMIFNRNDSQPFITAYNSIVNKVLSIIGRKLR